MVWCEIRPTRERALAPAGSLTPATLTVPEVGRSNPARTRRSVVLPAPFGPKSARHSPGASENVTPASACRLPKARVSSVTWTMGGALDEIVDDIRLLRL